VHEHKTYNVASEKLAAHQGRILTTDHGCSRSDESLCCSSECRSVDFYFYLFFFFIIILSAFVCPGQLRVRKTRTHHNRHDDDGNNNNNNNIYVDAFRLIGRGEPRAQCRAASFTGGQNPRSRLSRAPRRLFREG